MRGRTPKAQKTKQNKRFIFIVPDAETRAGISERVDLEDAVDTWSCPPAVPAGAPRASDLASLK